MFLTENVNHSDSVLFLLSARTTLKEMIELSDVESKDQLKEFIIKEASDYQVMSLLVDGVLPEEKENIISEGVLFSRMKEQIVRNYSSISELVEPSLLNNIIFEVDTLYPLSTSSILKESVEDSGKLGSLLEADTDMGGVDKHIAGVKAKRSADSFGGDYEVASSAGDKASSWWKYAINKGGSAVSVVQDWIGKHKDASTGIGAGVVAAIAAYAGYKMYKRFFSKAAKSCKGLSGDNKSACMLKYKNQALDAQAKELRKGLSACSKSSNPTKCKMVINNKITKIQSKKAG